jgi:hypothetical protein
MMVLNRFLLHLHSCFPAANNQKRKTEFVLGTIVCCCWVPRSFSIIFRCLGIWDGSFVASSSVCEGEQEEIWRPGSPVFTFRHSRTRAALFSNRLSAVNGGGGARNGYACAKEMALLTCPRAPCLPSGPTRPCHARSPLQPKKVFLGGHFAIIQRHHLAVPSSFIANHHVLALIAVVAVVVVVRRSSSASSTPCYYSSLFPFRPLIPLALYQFDPIEKRWMKWAAHSPPSADDEKEGKDYHDYRLCNTGIRYTNRPETLIRRSVTIMTESFFAGRLVWNGVK